MEALAFAQYGFAPALASALIHSLWQNALLGVAAALTLRAMARTKAKSRHRAAMAFLVAMALLPAVQFLRFWGQTGGTINDGLVPAMSAPQLRGAADVLVQQTSPLAPVLVLVWLLGVTMMLVRHVGALRALTALERRPYQPLPPSWQSRFDAMRGALRISRTVRVRVSDEVPSPFAARLLRPAIWLPLSLLTRAPVEQIEALLAHELAHIARKDWLWNGVQCVIECLLFFHPAIWWLGRRIRQEREHACDDLAVAACGDAIALAEALAALECERLPSARLALAAGGGSLVQRISRLLSGPPSRGRWGALAALAALAVTSAVVIAQIAIAGGRFPDLEVTASRAGPLRPGDFREIRAGGLDKQRFYRVSLDAQGRPTEIYEEDGQRRRIDADVRRWVDEVSRLSLTPPIHPEVPEPTYQAEYDALMRLVARQPDVVARLGDSAVATGRPPNGNVQYEGANGSADLEVEMRGPRGQAIVTVEAEMENRRWTLQNVEVQ